MIKISMLIVIKMLTDLGKKFDELTTLTQIRLDKELLRAEEFNN